MTGTNARWAWLALAVAWGAADAAAAPRTWTIADGDDAYSLDAELISLDEETVVLQREDHDLVAVPREQLSDEDRAFVESDDAGAAVQARDDAAQTWTLANGVQVAGRLVDFASQDVTIQRRRRRIYVNDRVMNNLPEFYRQLVPAIVGHYENLPRADLRALNSWLGRNDGPPHTFHVDGVIVETENGDEYAVPFFLFSDEDRKLLEGGWEEWLAVRGENSYDEQEDHAFLLRSLAAARQADADVKREIALLQLKMKAVEAGLTSLWEVTLWPAAGFGGPPIWVVVPGRDSRQATEAALSFNPGYVAGPVRRVSRR